MKDRVILEMERIAKINNDHLITYEKKLHEYEDYIEKLEGLFVSYYDPSYDGWSGETYEFWQKLSERFDGEE